MVRLVVAIVFLFGAGAVPALALAGARVEALPLSALLTGLMCSAAGMVAALLGGSVLVWALVLILACNIAGLVFLRRRSPRTDGIPGALWKLPVLIGAGLPLFGLRRPLIDWDARSIWSFHARWFYAGGRFVARALGNPAFVFSHADYPPAVPATIGALWRLERAIHLTVGQVTIAFLNFSAVALVGLAIFSLGSRHLPALRSATGTIVALASFGIAAKYGTDGYADLLWGACAAAGVVYLLAAPQTRDNLVLGLVCLLVGGLTKNEGTIVCLFILALAAVRYRSRVAQLALVGGSAAGLLVWPVLSRALGASSDLSQGLQAALAGKVVLKSRFLPIGRSMGTYVGIPIVVAAFCTLLGYLVLRRTRHRMQLGSSGWTWVAFAGSTLIIAAAYLITPYDLHWHLTTSVDRTTIALRMILLCEAMGWAMVAIEALAGRSAPAEPVHRAAVESAGVAAGSGS